MALLGSDVHITNVSVEVEKVHQTNSNVFHSASKVSLYEGGNYVWDGEHFARMASITQSHAALTGRKEVWALFTGNQSTKL